MAAYSMVLLRLDHIASKSEFIAKMREWMTELDLGGRLLSRAPQFHFLIVEGLSTDCDRFLTKYETEPVLLNAKSEVPFVALSLLPCMQTLIVNS